MSVHKLLQRISAPDLSADKFEIIQEGGDGLNKELNDFSHGIVHDPMALFAITFSALIHDVDHQGVSNAQLSKEYPDMADHYRNKSVAEQNSLDVAWDVLMMPKYGRLRKCIFETKDNLLRFRQLIVNTVLATDIFDKELNDLRRHRWEEAFSGSCPDQELGDLRATIVIEHIIQVRYSLVLFLLHVYITQSVIVANTNTRFFSVLFSFLIHFNRRRTYLIRCNIGTCTKSGTNHYSKRCTLPTRPVGWQKIHQPFGTRVNSVSLIIMSSPWQ